MIQKHIDKLEQEIKDNLEMIELLDSKRAEHVKNSSEYQAYLNSNEWQETRQRIFKRDNFRCVLCGCSKNLQVHHITYENLGEEKDADLVTFCDKCHNSIHSRTTNDYLTLAYANAYNISNNSPDESSRAKAERDMTIIRRAIDEINFDSNSSQKEAADILYMFAYAVRMGEKYDKLDTDLKLSESDFPPEMKNIVGNNLNSVINKCLIGAGDKEINEDFAQIKYFQLLEAKINQREDYFLRLRFGASDDVQKEIDNTLKNLSQCKQKLKKLGETL